MLARQTNDVLNVSQKTHGACPFFSDRGSGGAFGVVRFCTGECAGAEPWAYVAEGEWEGDAAGEGGG